MVGMLLGKGSELDGITYKFRMIGRVKGRI